MATGANLFLLLRSEFVIQEEPQAIIITSPSVMDRMNN